MAWLSWLLDCGVLRLNLCCWLVQLLAARTTSTEQTAKNVQTCLGVCSPCLFEVRSSVLSLSVSWLCAAELLPQAQATLIEAMQLKDRERFRLCSGP